MRWEFSSTLFHCGRSWFVSVLKITAQSFYILCSPTQTTWFEFNIHISRSVPINSWSLYFRDRQKLWCCYMGLRVRCLDSIYFNHNPPKRNWIDGPAVEPPLQWLRAILWNAQERSQWEYQYEIELKLFYTLFSLFACMWLWFAGTTTFFRHLASDTSNCGRKNLNWGTTVRAKEFGVTLPYTYEIAVSPQNLLWLNKDFRRNIWEGAVLVFCFARELTKWRIQSMNTWRNLSGKMFFWGIRGLWLGLMGGDFISMTLEFSFPTLFLNLSLSFLATSSRGKWADSEMLEQIFNKIRLRKTKW